MAASAAGQIGGGSNGSGDGSDSNGSNDSSNGSGGSSTNLKEGRKEKDGRRKMREGWGKKGRR